MDIYFNSMRFNIPKWKVYSVMQIHHISKHHIDYYLFLRAKCILSSAPRPIIHFTNPCRSMSYFKKTSMLPHAHTLQPQNTHNNNHSILYKYIYTVHSWLIGRRLPNQPKEWPQPNEVIRSHLFLWTRIYCWLFFVIHIRGAS